MSKFIVMATWDDAPHLSDKEKEELWESIPVHQRDARSKGIPQLGSGAVYPLAEEEITVPDFEIPTFWKRSYALDVGWNRTAALWGAIDQENDIHYLYSEYYQSEAKPLVHSYAIKGRGDWIQGVIDPASRGRSQKDGTQLIKEYRDLGLKLREADNAVEAGITRVWMRLSSGKTKIFKSLVNFLSEYRIYRRDENGKIVKDKDHLMDCLRYWEMTGSKVATYMPTDLYLQKKNFTHTVDDSKGIFWEDGR